MRLWRARKSWPLLALLASLVAGQEVLALGLPSLLQEPTAVLSALPATLKTAIPKKLPSSLPTALLSAADGLLPNASNAQAARPAAKQDVRAPVLPWVLPVPTAERTDAGTLAQSEVDSVRAAGVGPLALADVTGVADVATGGAATKTLTDLVKTSLRLGKSAQDVLPTSVLNPVKDALTLGGSPLLTEPLGPAPTFDVVGGGNQNKVTREDPYQDISKRAKSAHAPSGAGGSAVGAAVTRASLAAAFASPDIVRTDKFGSNFLPAVNVFLTTLVRMLIDV